VYRDAKKHTSLTSCQAKNKEKLHSHFNLSFTAVNLAKIVHWYSILIEKRKSFSMADVKTINHNTLLLERFIAMFAIKPNVLKNNQNVKELLYIRHYCRLMLRICYRTIVEETPPIIMCWRHNDMLRRDINM